MIEVQEIFFHCKGLGLYEGSGTSTKTPRSVMFGTCGDPITKAKDISAPSKLSRVEIMSHESISQTLKIFKTCWQARR